MKPCKWEMQSESASCRMVRRSRVVRVENDRNRNAIRDGSRNNKKGESPKELRLLDKERSANEQIRGPKGMKLCETLFFKLGHFRKWEDVEVKNEVGERRKASPGMVVFL